MAFENNQQDAFNLRNDTESLKQWQSELDKATTSIGAAEVAAEEELAALKLKNLAALQDARVKKLNELIEQEEAGIRELAALKLKLSDKQFEARKKEIQKELQLLKDSAKESFKPSNKKTQTTITKPASPTKDITTASKTTSASTATTKGVPGKVNTSEARPQKEQEFSNSTNGLKEVDLGKYLFDDVRAMFEASSDAIKRQSSNIEKALNDVTANNGRGTTQSSIDLAGELLKNFNSAEDAIRKVREFNENKDLNERLTKLAEEQKLRASHEEAIFTLIEERIKTEAALTYTGASRDKLIAQEEQKLKNEHESARLKAIQANIVAVAKANDLEHNRRLYEQEEYRALRNAFAEEQNKLTKEEIEAEAKLKFVKNNEERLRDQAAHKLRIGHINAEHDAMQELINAQVLADDLKNSRQKYLDEAGQKLKDTHADKVNELTQASINAEAKANELKNNQEAYALEARIARENAFSEKQNQLLEEQYSIEEEIAYDNAHRAEILAQKEHELKNKHRKEEHEAVLNTLLDAKANLSTGFDGLLKTLKIPEEGSEKDKKISGDPTLALLADIIKKSKEDEKAAEEAAKNGTEAPKPQVYKTTIDISSELIKSIEEARKAEEELQEFKKDQERITQLLRQKREQERLKELSKNEREQAEKLANLEEDIAFNAAHREELLAQALRDKQISYAEEYKNLQLDSTSHITENMTKEQFIALREQTKAAEESIARREKASAASEKALAIIRGKGTIKEKKALLEAQIKERAAEKDWSKTKLAEKRPGESDEDLQKRRENAVKAEMAVNAAMGALADLAQKLNNQTDKIGAKQASIDTRLQGSTANTTRQGSYWKQLAQDMNKIGAVNPYFKQENFANNLETLVNRGISFDVKQRAFLMTIQEKIANTFEVADGTLLRLIRIQQQDTTAGRLGMESALNSFLNSMYETSEYLSDVASSVRGSLEEMQALMEGAAGTELEFQVQKWMGSLYSVGMSQEAVQGIAQAFGQIASGDISGLTGSGTSNLLIMAANEAGMSIADILQDGLNADETNKLMQAMVNYLAEIAESSSDSRVVQQQLANVYGVKASDLKAATNLASSIKDVAKQDLTYGGMLGQLNKMANSMGQRTSMAEKLTNVWENTQYTMATTMGNNPVLYLLPKVANLLESFVGGIDLPFVNAFGTGVDLNTSVAQLMNVAAMSGTILDSLGPMISGIGAAVSGSVMLSNAGISTSGKAPVIARGSATPLQHLGGLSMSESGYVGNASGSDIKNQTLQGAEDDKKKLLVEAKDEESAADTSTKANLAVVNIYNLLEEVAHGSQSLRVRVVNNVNVTGSSMSNSGGSAPLGENAGDGATTATTSAGKYGTDNGNWVLSF